MIGALDTRHQKISTRIEGLGSNRTNRDHQNYCIIEIGQNTGKSISSEIPSANAGV